MTMPAAILMSKRIHLNPAPSLYDYCDAKDLNSFCLAFRPDDKIHLFPPSKETAYTLHGIVEKHWTIESCEVDPDCYTLTLEGSPFLMYTRRENAMLIKFICCLILERFKGLGWELVACTNLSSRIGLSTWYFARLSPIEKKLDDENCFPLVCLSLSAKRKLQLINAPKDLQQLLRDLVKKSYERGIDQDAHYGRDYQIKLNGTPWDTEIREEIVSACKLILAAFRQFGAVGYNLYGLVNLKDTADSLFFEYNPAQILQENEYMMVALDKTNILRLIDVSLEVVNVVKTIVDRFWDLGWEAEGQIGRSPKTPSVETSTRTSWEFVLKGNPWQASDARVGRSRQFVTYLLDALLAHGWTVVTGLDISRQPNRKSTLLFQRCQPVRNLRHACLSPLGKHGYQLINAPEALRQLVRSEFEDVIVAEHLSEDESLYKMTLQGHSWWDMTPDQEQQGYMRVRRRMGQLLETLADFGWSVICSADVAHQEIEPDEDVGHGIHSWFVIYCGLPMNTPETKTVPAVKVTCNSVLQVQGRVGSPVFSSGVNRRSFIVRHGSFKQAPDKARNRSASIANYLIPGWRIKSTQRPASPPVNYEARRKSSRSRSVYEL